nr:WAT1-related protein At3g28050-like [Ipomoea batatas]
MAMAAKVEGALPYLGMVLAQFAQVGLMIIGKAAMSSGMTNFTWVFYSNALAALLLLPSFFFQRSTRPPLTFSLICWFFLMGILGCSAQLTGYTGINYTSSSFASAMLNLIPEWKNWILPARAPWQNVLGLLCQLLEHSLLLSVRGRRF